MQNKIMTPISLEKNIPGYQLAYGIIVFGIIFKEYFL
jgi:hypothetical protein